MEATAKSRYVCAVIWRQNPESRVVEFLVMDSYSTDPATKKKTTKQVKFPGGMNRITDEPLHVNVQREVLEETHLAFPPASSEQIWEKAANENHTKYGFLISFEECRGNVRTEVLHDNGDEMSPPYWVAAHELGRALFHSHQFVHLAALQHLKLI